MKAYFLSVLSRRNPHQVAADISFIFMLLMLKGQMLHVLCRKMFCFFVNLIWLPFATR